MIDIVHAIQIVVDAHPEFSHQEISDLSNEYMDSLKKTMKESSKQKSLLSFLRKEFSVSFDEEGAESLKEESEIVTGFKAFSSIPKQYFQSSHTNVSDHLVRIQKLTKTIGTTELFDEADLNIKAGDHCSLIGKNGAGKSTLLKMIIGKDGYDSGDIQITKGVTVGFLSQDLFRSSMDNTVEQEMLTTLPDVTKTMHRLHEIEKLVEEGSDDAVQLLDEQGELIERMIHHDGYQKYSLQVEVLSYFGLTKKQLSLPVKKLSGGEQTKVQIAKFLIQEVDLLILDEPTNHLDIEGIMFLEKFCQSRKKTLICISHDKAFLNNVCQKVIEIDQKKLVLYHGDYDSYVVQKEKNRELQMKQYVNQQKYLKQQETFIERFRYKASRAAQVQSRIKQLDKIDTIEAPTEDSTPKKINLKVSERLPQQILQLHDLTVGYDQSSILIGLPPIVEVTKEMKIGVVGKNGIGKTTLLKTILGELPAVYGGVTLSDAMNVGSYSQVAEELDRKSTVSEELMVSGVSHREVRSLLGSLLFSSEKMDQRIETLSGGERAKVALTKMLLQRPNLIIMDEPTNHLDIASKDAIKLMLEKFNGVSIIVSHDRDFLLGVSNRLWVIKDQQLTEYIDEEEGFEALIG